MPRGGERARQPDSAAGKSSRTGFGLEPGFLPWFSVHVPVTAPSHITLLDCGLAPPPMPGLLGLPEKL